MDSLLVALRRYPLRPDRDPLEDFLTEAFAWTLRQTPELARALLHEIDGSAPEPDRTGPASGVTWATQVPVGEGIADMVARRGTRAVLFEHKTYSPATADQVDAYRKALARKPGTTQVTTVLITASRWNYTGSDDPDVRDPDVHMTWGEVCEVTRGVADTLGDRSRADDFLALLHHEGFAPSPSLSESRLRAFAAAQGVTGELFALVNAVRTSCDWSFVYEQLPAPSEAPQRPERWTSVGQLFNGRIPFDLFQPWEPGLRVGLIVDPSDLGTSLTFSEAGPDLAVYLGIPKDELGPAHADVLRSAPLHALGERLRQTLPKAWTLTARPGKTSTAIHSHHPVVVQQPLAPVICNKSARDAQRDAVFEELRSGVTAFLDGTEMQDLRRLIQTHLR